MNQRPDQFNNFQFNPETNDFNQSKINVFDQSNKMGFRPSPEWGPNGYYNGTYMYPDW
jgi:hypothetical protein